MDIIAQHFLVAVSKMNLEPLKEPRGFIKLIELIIAIFAFATTTSFSSVANWNVKCSSGELITQSLSISYPFRIDSNEYEVPLCSSEKNGTVGIYGDGGTVSSAEFYVFIGVMAFLYTIGALILYIFFDDRYQEYEQLPTADFVISVVFAVLWLISSSAWAQGLTDLKYYSDPSEQFFRFNECKNDGCAVTTSATYASLNVSVIFGFLNMFVWGGNLWFLYKETRWFNKGSEVPPPPQGISHQPPMQPNADFPSEYPSQGGFQGGFQGQGANFQ